MAGLAVASHPSGLMAFALVGTSRLHPGCRGAVQRSGAVADPARARGSARLNEEDLPARGCPYVSLEHFPGGHSLSEIYIL